MNENFSYIIDRLWEVTGANLYYSEGNVGIGTSSPSQKPEVAGTMDTDDFTVNGTPVGTSTDSFWNNPSTPDIRHTAGNVGIGTTNLVALWKLQQPEVITQKVLYYIRDLQILFGYKSH